LRGRNFASGQAMFEAASCSACHNMEGRGGNVGADLSQAGKNYPGAELLRHILEPAITVKPEHRIFGIELDDGSQYFGQVVKDDGESVTITESLQEPDVTVTLYRDEIDRMVPLKTSPMPTGLLVTLSHDEVLNLLAYIAANGDKNDAVFK
jgi:putative heme-binding domain-containing protein